MALSAVLPWGTRRGMASSRATKPWSRHLICTRDAPCITSTNGDSGRMIWAVLGNPGKTGVEPLCEGVATGLRATSVSMSAD